MLGPRVLPGMTQGTRWIAEAQVEAEEATELSLTYKITVVPSVLLFQVSAHCLDVKERHWTLRCCCPLSFHGKWSLHAGQDMHWLLSQAFPPLQTGKLKERLEGVDLQALQKQVRALCPKLSADGYQEVNSGRTIPTESKVLPSGVLIPLAKADLNMWGPHTHTLVLIYGLPHAVKIQTPGEKGNLRICDLYLYCK